VSFELLCQYYLIPVSGKYGGNVWTEFVWLSIGTRGGPFWTR